MFAKTVTALAAFLLSSGCAAQNNPVSASALPDETRSAIHQLGDDLFSTLLAGDYASAESLFTPPTGYAELERHMHEDPPPPEAIERMREETRRRFESVSQALRSAQEAENLGMREAEWQIHPAVADWIVMNLILHVRLDGQERRIRLDRAVRVSGHWHIFQGPQMD